MATYVRVRGLARRGFRVRTSLAATGGNAVTIANNQTVIVDLDDPKTRADITHHSSIGQLQIVDFVPRQASAAANAGAWREGGVVTIRPGSLVADVSAGIFLWNDAGTLRTVVMPAQTVTFTANATGNQRTDLVTLDVTAGGATGAYVVVAGATTLPFGAGAAPAAPDAVVAEAQIAPGAVAPTYILDRRTLV